MIRFLLIILISLLIACQPVSHQSNFYAFGTLIHIIAYDTDQAKLIQAIDEAEILLNSLHKRWHAWQPSEITEINQAFLKKQEIIIAQDTLSMLKKAYDLSVQSQSLFNPAIGSLIHLWGFQSDILPDSPPDPILIKQFVEYAPSLLEVHFNGHSISSQNPHVQLDLGAFAKGYAIDLLIDLFKKYGIKNVLINAGGDIKVLGHPPHRAWSVGIRHPRQEGVLAGVWLDSEESIVTSGDYERYFMYENQRYHHILDPSTGYPTQDIIAVTVITQEAAKADAAATAILVAGKDWLKIAKAMQIEQVLVVTAEGKLHATEKMAARLRFDQEKPAINIYYD